MSDTPSAQDDTGPDRDSAATAPDAAGASSYSWYVLGVLVIIYTLNFIDRQIISILANDIKADLNLTDADLGFLYGTAFAVFYALFGIPFGKLADSWNRTWLMTLGLSLWSAMTALSGLAQNGVMLAAARLGVGVGEATASPSAYSLISDWFPKNMRGTALAIYSTGVYLGGGLSLAIGGLIVEQWNGAYPDGGAFGLVGWQVAFMAVGIPGLLLAIWVYSLREPERGAIDGITAKAVAKPFAGFVQELFAIIPPFTLFSAARAGGRTLIINIVAAFIIAAVAAVLIYVTGSVLQWVAAAIGYYAIVSWADTLRQRDNTTFALIWGTPAFLYTIIGYGCVAFISYSISFWASPYAERVLGESKSVIGWYIGGGGAMGGFLGVIIGGWLSDRLRERNPAGRILVIAFGLLAPIIPILIAFTTDDAALFYGLNIIISLFGSTALGAAAATTQDLVLPRMRGTATATFFLATTLFALALGPYLAGYVSFRSESLSIGIMSILVVVPLGVVTLALAYRQVPKAEQTLLARAKACGEAV